MVSRCMVQAPVIPNDLPVVTEVEVDHHQEGVEAEANAEEEVDPEALREPAHMEVYKE